MVNDPNSVLHAAIAGEHITSTTTLHVTSSDTPVPGGGTANTAFLKGGPPGPNAVTASVVAMFWLETVQGQPAENQLQYSADRAAELQRIELAARHRRYAAQSLSGRAR